MSYTNYVMKIEWMIELIKQENTGCADCFAEKLEVSRRTIFRYLDELRLKGAEIGYSKTKETYYLNNNFNFTEDFLKSAIKWHSTALALEKIDDNSRIIEV